MDRAPIFLSILPGGPGSITQRIVIIVVLTAAIIAIATWVRRKR